VSVTPNDSACEFPQARSLDVPLDALLGPPEAVRMQMRRVVYVLSWWAVALIVDLLLLAALAWLVVGLVA
jgi:hypothetical protein